MFCVTCQLIGPASTSMTEIAIIAYTNQSNESSLEMRFVDS